MTKPSILYITYDGILEPLGQSQVLAYLEQLAQQYKIHLLSFEKPQDWNDLASKDVITQRIQRAGINWKACRYHKKPSALATAFDILHGYFRCLQIKALYGFDIIHARSYVPAVMALLAKKTLGTKFIFDMRGFWADERIDGGLWPKNGKMYRVAKWFEKQFLLGADHVVSLTHAAITEIKSFPYIKQFRAPITVIPTCVDLNKFQLRKNSRREYTLGYVGSAGTWYNFDATVKCFKSCLELNPNSRFLILNRNEQDLIRTKIAEAGVPSEAVEIRAASFSEIPGFLAQVDASVFFIKPLFSKQASAPTKLGELLACGIPCLTNSNVGDMAAILANEQVGISIADFSSEAITQGLSQLMQLKDQVGIRERCASASLKHFSLQTGVERYAGIYQSLIEP